MNIVDYARQNKDLSFEEKPFNNVDAVIFAAISYLNFDLVAPSIKEKDKRIYLRDITDEQVTILCNTRNFKEDSVYLIKCMINSKRYKDISVQYVMRIMESLFLEQFFALTFDIPSVGYYIIYRGTDSTSIGWNENFSQLVKGVTASQLDATDYLRIVSGYLNGAPLMIGGHSKGGNLSFYAAFFAKEEISKTITRAYSFDGTGFVSKKYTEQPLYEEMLAKTVQIVPKGSIVGELFYTPNNHTIVKSTGKGFEQHSLYRWITTEDGDFYYLKKRSFSSKVFHRAVKKWAKNGIKSDKELFIDVVVKAFSVEDNGFKLFDETESARKKIKLTTKLNYARKERFRFYKYLIKFAIYYIRSFYYYVFKAMLKPFRRKNKKTADKSNIKQ